MAAEITPAEAEEESERLACLAWERQQLDHAREDVRAGRVVADADVNDLLDRPMHGDPLRDPEGLQTAIKKVLDSGPGLPADQVFTELRARYPA